MTKINELVEWDYLGSHYSLYCKHFTDEEGRRGMTMIFEDQTHDKVTEMVVPAHKFSHFLKVVNEGTNRFGGII